MSGWKHEERERERKSKMRESVSTKRKRKSKRGGGSMTEGLCVEEQPLLSLFFKSQCYQYK